MAFLGVDTGGTFTDFLWIGADGGIEVRKLPSTPDDPSRVIRAAFLTDQRDRSDLTLAHGSTVATNTLLERRGARTALVTTEGFADVIEIGRQDRPRIYDVAWQPPAPLIPRELRFELEERMGPGGKVVRELSSDAVHALMPKLEAANVESVAVCFLFSPENPAHEELVADLLQPLGVPVVASSRLHPELREYERFSTATVSAYVAPVMARYLERLAREVEPGRLLVMESGGGVLPWRDLVDRAVGTVLSGPAGGVRATATLVEDTGLVAFDMGGTSTDVSLILPGMIPRTRQFAIDGVPVAIPVVDVHTVGAGGGSLAWVDPGGALRVGPRSAGSEPGPVCYGRGGSTATVTDANYFLGRLPQDTRLGGEMALESEGVARAMESLARELHLSPLQAAHGIVRIIEAEMERALRRITQERGLDPRDLSLVAFGGAGGLHAVALARALQMREVLVPPNPGILSAVGMLLAPEEHLASAVVQDVWNDQLARRIQQECEAREAACRQRLTEGASASVTRELSLRYQGQSHEIDVTWRSGEDPVVAFELAYRERYGAALQGTAVEVTAVRSRVAAPPPLSELPLPQQQETQELSETEVFLDDGDQPVRVSRVSRSALREGEVLVGPAILEEPSSTLWLPPGARLRKRGDGCLTIQPRS